MSTTNPTVEYRDIPGFPGYRVGSDGTVWSCRSGGRGKLSTNWKKMFLTITKHGRVRVTLKINKKKSYRHVHRLVLEAFVGSCPPGMECRHFPDRDPKNNSLSNLSWGTHLENTQDKFFHGTVIRGEDIPQAKLTEACVRSLRRRYLRGVSLEKLSKDFQISKVNAWRVATRKTWKHIS